MTALLPLELQEDYVVQNLSLKDMTKAERACKAKLLVIGDELTGIAHSQRDLVNSFITSTMSFVGEKFERERNIPRTAWLIATSNQMYLPDDEANSTKNRILPCEVKPRAESNHLDADVKGKEIFKWYEENRMDILAGGMIDAEAGLSLEAPDSILNLRAESIYNISIGGSDLIDRIKEIIDRLTKKQTIDGLWILPRDVARELGLLDIPEGDFHGKIPPIGTKEMPWGRGGRRAVEDDCLRWKRNGLLGSIVGKLDGVQKYAQRPQSSRVDSSQRIEA